VVVHGEVAQAGPAHQPDDKDEQKFLTE